MIQKYKYIYINIKILPENHGKKQQALWDKENTKYIRKGGGEREVEEGPRRALVARLGSLECGGEGKVEGPRRDAVGEIEVEERPRRALKARLGSYERGG
ncbi:hypothetical protein BYT27DRAFT_7187948 [Phlegmacium glaucopus]|nr:hypothetical protein BYT27DRAFT_7187948 [Phlegmacium glaucopus]